jgi:hypothetical protein
MAWSASKIFVSFIEDALENTTAFNLPGDTFRVALYNNDDTPDNTVAAANTVYNVGVWETADEVYDGAEWVQTGELLVSPTFAPTAAVLKFDGTDTVSAGTSATLDTWGCLVYDTTCASKGLCYNSFGGEQKVTDGTFTVVWNSAGIFTLTLT